MATKETEAETYWVRRTRCLGISVLFGVGAPGLAYEFVQLSPELGVFEGWSDGVGVVAISILLGMAALAAFFGHRVWGNDRLWHRAVAELMASPEVDDGLDAVDPEEETRRLRFLSRRAAAFTIGAVPVMVMIVLSGLNHLPDPPEDGVAVVALTVVMSLYGVGAGLYAMESWRRRYRSVLATGWRTARVTVNLDHDQSNPEGEPRIFDVKFSDGERIRLRGLKFTFRAGHRFTWRRGIRVWVGGEGESMVLLFPRGPKIRPAAVPARQFTGAAK